MIRITLVTIKKIAMETYIRQLKEFFGREALITGYAMEEDPGEIQGDIVLLTSYFLMRTVKRKLADSSVQVVHISNTFSKKQIERMKKIPEGSKVLVVNSTKEMAYDCISQFEQIMGSRLAYTAYSEKEDKNIDPAAFSYAVTFIEDFRGSGGSQIIPLGSRKIHPYILQSIVDSCFSENRILHQRLNDYEKQMIAIDYASIEMDNIGKEWEEILNLVISMTDQGAVILDDNNEIKGINEAAMEVLDVHTDDCYGKNADWIPALSELHDFIENTGENIKVQVYCNTLEQMLLVRKRVVQFYAYRFMTVLFLEKQSESIADNAGKMRAKFTFNDIVGSSPKLCSAVEVAKKIAYSDNAVLLNGETGTGKEIFAHAMHNRSSRNNRPFVAINCAAFPESLLESELFGYEAGAFTGALKKGKRGIFEQADGGTVFLDEIGDAPLSIQAKLLRVLQEKEVRRIGGEENIAVNVRIISATNRDLKRMIREERFRKDLYYRLNTFTLTIPPLRERPEDIEALAEYFLQQDYYGYKRIDPAVIQHLKHLPWEGNIREFKNCIDYMAFMAGDRIDVSSLPEEYAIKSVVSPDSNRTLGDNRFSREDNVKIQFILETLYYKSVGRSRLLSLAAEKDIELTEYHLKRLLKKMQEMDYLEIKKGRGGIVLTEKGETIVKEKE